MASQPTQLDIAKQLGVSLTTVSRALRNCEDIGPDMKAQVAEVADRIGYKVNAFARNLARHRHTGPQQRLPLALLNLWTPPSQWRKELWSKNIHEGCVARAEELGYYVDEINVRAPGMSAERTNRILVNRGVQGVVIAPSPQAYSHLRLDWERFASCAIGFTFRRPDLHRVTCNYPLAMQLILRNLKHCGYERIGLRIARDHDSRMNGGLTSAFLHYRETIAKSSRVPIYYHSGLLDDGEPFLKWVKKERVDVALTQDTIALRWLQDAGYSVPDDIGFVHLNVNHASRTRGGIDVAGISIEYWQTGAKAVEMVIHQLEHNERGIPTSPSVMLVAPRWVPGATIRARS